LNGYSLVLKDLITGKDKIIQSGDGYTYTKNAGESVNRFALSIAQSNAAVTNAVSIYSFDKTVYINASNDVAFSSIDVYDLFGNHVKTLSVTDATKNEYNLADLTNGLYIVKTISTAGIISEKIILK